MGENPANHPLGKESCTLAWAIEDTNSKQILVAVRNWLEESWRLFGMTALMTGDIDGAGNGWRRALHPALGDIAQSERLSPRARHQSRLGHDDPLLMLDLLDRNGT